MKKKTIATIVTGGILVLTLGLVSCGGSPTEADKASQANEAAKASESAATAAESKPSSNDESSSATSAPTPAPVPTPTPAPAQGKPQITMGKLGMVHVHETGGSMVADVVIQVTNTGDVPLVMSNPVIKVADASGSVIAEVSGDGIVAGPTYLGVQDIGFIYSIKPIQLPAGTAPGTNYLAQGSADLTACADVHQFPLSNLKIGDGGREVPVVTGTVTNDTTESVPSVEVTALYVDNDTHMLGVATTHVSDLAPGTSQDFTIGADSLPIGCSLALVSDYDVMAVAPKR